MRVLYLSNDFGPHDRRFLSSLARTRHEIHFLRLVSTTGSPESAGVPARVHEVALPGSLGLFRWWAVPTLVMRLRRAIKEVQPDLIHAGPIQTCAFLAVLSGFRPILTMSWGFDLMQDADRTPFSRWVTRYTLQRSTYFVSDARVTQERAISFGMRPDLTAVFPWGVDLRRFRPQTPSGRNKTNARMPGKLKARSAKRMAKRGMVLLCNRSWERRYGVDVLAQAFVNAASELPDVSLILFGSGSQGAEIQAILAKEAQAGRVRYCGRVPQSKIHRIYPKADLYISPSHIDGSSVSLMEALACGIPVLVSDIPANREWVMDGVNGWLFRDGDSKHLAERIVWIASRKVVLPQIRRAARRTAEERADWRINFKVLLDAYERAMAQERHS